ncbi:MAG: hypothetical protein C0482_19775 [Gordonia sp.]|nr:hypothetical protein [Gordonia sp. (in: high G+C Gram-positive bacteria)]
MQLSPNTSIYQARQGYVLRTADDEHFELTLPPVDIEQLFEVLAGGSAPESASASAALSALIEAGHVTAFPTVPLVNVRGQGKVAAATSKLLENLTVDTERAEFICYLSDDEAASHDVGTVDLVSYRDGITQVITPRAVDVADVLGRRRACTAHRDRIQPRYRPIDAGRRIDSALHPVSDRAAQAIGEVIVAEIADRASSRPRCLPYQLTAVDLRTLAVSRHPVLPLPVAPQ